MSDKERKVIEDTVAHWERMIAWAEKQWGSWVWSKEFGHNQNMIDMYRAIGETAGSPCCPLCMTYKICASCPLFVRFGSCNDGSGGNLYRTLKKCTSWSEWARAARAFLEQIKSLLPKEIDWTRPIRIVGKSGLVDAVTEVTLRIVSINGIEHRVIDEFGRELNVDILEVGPRIIENVPEEPEYIPLKRGDRLTVDNNEYLLVQVGAWWSLIDMARGSSWKSIEQDDACCDYLSLSEFKSLLQGKAGQWQEIYKTVRRREG